jgi:hypothetical protein
MIRKTILLNTGFNPILFLKNCKREKGGCVDEKERGPQVKLRSQNHASLELHDLKKYFKYIHGSSSSTCLDFWERW